VEGESSAPRSASPARWVVAATPEELLPGHVLDITAATLRFALFNVNGKILAVDSQCPHKQGPLAGGRVTGTVVTCPLHSWKFDLESGESVNHPGARVRTYAVRVGEGKIEVLLPV
jgi:nitrite reductase (NADH) small subunit